jgi:hypothetical protein
MSLSAVQTFVGEMEARLASGATETVPVWLVASMMRLCVQVTIDAVRGQPPAAALAEPAREVIDPPAAAAPRATRGTRTDGRRRPWTDEQRAAASERMKRRRAAQRAGADGAPAGEARRAEPDTFPDRAAGDGVPANAIDGRPRGGRPDDAAGADAIGPTTPETSAA